MKRWVVAFFVIATIVDVGFATANAVLYIVHHKGENLFAAIWCLVMWFVVLFCWDRVTKAGR